VAYDPYALSLGLSVVLGTCMAYLRNVLLAVMQHEFTDPEDLVAAFLNLHAQVEKAALVCACTALETGYIILDFFFFFSTNNGRLFFSMSVHLTTPNSPPDDDRPRLRRLRPLRRFQRFRS
jgi:hypothetical protein